MGQGRAVSKIGGLELPGLLKLPANRKGELPRLRVHRARCMSRQSGWGIVSRFHDPVRTSLNEAGREIP